MLRTHPAVGRPRYELMDVARGFAVLGILWLNIFLFALPFEALVIPGIWGEANALNETVWNFTTVFVAGTMRGMFSILFGASAMLLLSRAEKADDQVTAIDRYFRRLLWLIVFGTVHAYLLIWPHDILYAYGVLGMLIFPFRHVSSRRLAAVAAIMIAASALFTDRNVEEISEARSAVEDTLTNAERERLQDEEPLVEEPLLEFEDGSLSAPPLWQPAALAAPAEGGAEDGGVEDDLEALVQRMSAEMAERQGGYLDNLVAMAPDSFQQQTTEMIGNHLLDIGAFMLVGMVLFRTGFFHGLWSGRRYARVALGGLALGTFIGLVTRLEVDEASAFYGAQQAVADYGFDLRRLALALAFFSLLALLVRSGGLPGLRRRLAACGRMALSLYVAQTIVCNFVFLGYGLSLFGQFEHYEVMGVCVALTLLQLIVAPLVLARFGQGPLEALLKRLIDWGAPRPSPSTPSPLPERTQPAS